MVTGAPSFARLEWPRLVGSVELRPAVEADVPAIHVYRRRPDVVRYLSHDVLTLDEVRDRVLERIERGRPGSERPLLALAVVDPTDGRVVGDLMLRLDEDPPGWAGTIGYVLHPDLQGRGVASALAREMVRIGLEDLGLSELRAEANAENLASRRVLAKAGFREVGVVEELDVKRRRADDGSELHGIPEQSHVSIVQLQLTPPEWRREAV